VGTTGLLLILVFGAGSFQADLQTRFNMRWARPESAELSWFQTRARLAFTPVRSRKLDSEVEIEIRASAFPGLTSASQLGQMSALEPVEVLLGQAFVRVYDMVPGMNLTIGRQLVPWGTADVINPTSNLCPPDYSDPLVWDARRPAWMVHAEYNPVLAFGLELAARPVFEPATATTQRWFKTRILPTETELRQGLVASFIEQGIAPDTAQMLAAMYRINIKEDFQVPGAFLKNTSYGGRAKTHFSVFDLSAGLFRGFEFLPQAWPITVIDPDSMCLDFTLQERYPRNTVVGADLAANLFDVGVWAEGAYTMYDDSLSDDRFDWIVGLDYTLFGVYANVQYLHGRFPLALAQTRAEPVENYLFGALERKFADDRLMLRFGGVVDVKKGSFGLLPLVRWMPVSGLEIDLGGLVFSGGDGSAFQPMENNDELFLGVRYRF